LAHGYRTLQHWNQWLAQPFLGTTLIAEEQALLARLLNKHFGKHALLIGVPEQRCLLEANMLACQSLLSPIIHSDPAVRTIEGDFNELPLLTGSLDLVLLPHTLEFIDNPRRLLAEACRVVKPEGLIVICGFNPYSFWGLSKKLNRQHVTPWLGNYYPAKKIKSWLQLADFVLEEQQSLFFRPPLQQMKLFDKLHFLETFGTKCFPSFGGVYILLARAKVIPLTPIRLKWKQQFSGIRISTTISGPIAR
jgi:SAM-dependent methyltransferase